MAAYEVNVQEAKDIVEKVIKTDIVPFLWGPPGVGKSSIIKEVAKEHGYDLIDLRLSLLNPVDLRGLPSLNKEKHEAEWLKPGFLPTDKTPNKGILFLDEINLAPQSVQAAAYQLILDKKLGEYQFPKHWRIIAAGNREIDKANVYKLSAPLANRFAHLTVVESFKIWNEWAKEFGIREEIVEFLNSRPSMLLQMPKGTEKAFPSPRSWHFVSDFFNAFDVKNQDDVANVQLESLIVGTIGEPVAREFLQFVEQYNLKEVREVLENFKRGKEVTLPKYKSSRLAITKGILVALVEREITKERYNEFMNLLNSEERATMEAWVDKNKSRLQEKYGAFSI